MVVLVCVWVIDPVPVEVNDWHGRERDLRQQLASWLEVSCRRQMGGSVRIVVGRYRDMDCVPKSTSVGATAHSTIRASSSSFVVTIEGVIAFYGTVAKKKKASTNGGLVDVRQRPDQLTDPGEKIFVTSSVSSIESFLSE